jgi:hypothetical protein
MFSKNDIHKNLFGDYEFLKIDAVKNILYLGV